MKKQRIFLHTLILVLAAACFGTAAYGWTKYANVKAKNEYRWEYQDQYETLVTDSLQDIVAQYLYIKNFSDNKKDKKGSIRLAGLDILLQLQKNPQCRGCR